MPSFDASGVVEGLECRLLPYAQFDGVIPEPSDKQVGEFLAGLRKAIRESRERTGAKDQVDPGNPEQVAAALEELDPEEFERTAGVMAELHAGLCSGTPSAEQILAVPRRARLHFYNWLQTEVLTPEVGTPAGNAQVRTLPQRAAG